jgi:hypothetical protein
MRALLLVALAACADDTTLRFSDLDDNTIDRLVEASFGGDAWWAAQDVERFRASSDACPTVTKTDGVVTMVGGCTTGYGTAIEGVARARSDGTNTTYEFDHYRVGGRGYDGTLHVSDGSVANLEIAADLTFDGTRHSSMLVDCDGAGCKLSGGIELLGHGSVTVSGTTPAVSEQVPGASWKLRGDETLEVWSEDRPYACVQWRIVETGRTPALVLCPR